MKIKVIAVLLILYAGQALSVTQCVEKIKQYYVGTSTPDEVETHLWVEFENGGTASVLTSSKAFDAMLSTVMTSVVADKVVEVRYFSDNAICQGYNSDWIGIWLKRSS